jgi:SulP family sulfate permease
MAIHYHVDEISISPLRKDISSYSWDVLRKDLLAAFSVCLMTIPQAMAYALLAGLPIACGLFAAIFSALFAPAFGSSRHLVLGPSNAIAILVQAAISDVMYTYYRHLNGPDWDMMAIQVLSQLVILIAFLQILAALCKLGKLTQFVSHSVVVGYITGTAIAIIINQLFTLLGIEQMPGVRSLYERGAYLLTHIGLAHLPSALLGIGSLLVIMGLKKIHPKIPAGVLAFILASLVVYVFDLSSFDFDSTNVDPYAEDRLQKVMLVGDAGGLFDLTPKISWPYFDTGIMNDLLPVAFALALLGVMETTAVAKSIAASSGQRLSTNQEIFGLGIGNLISAFVSGMPISGSPSRTMANYQNGAQTRFAGIYCAIFVGVLVFAGGNLIAHIPLASLAALLLYSAVSIVNSRQFFLCLKTTSSDAFVLWMTLLACVFFSLDVAFYIGVVLSITLYLKKAAMPQLVEYDIDDSGELVNLSFCRAKEQKSIRVIKVEGELFFGAADLFQTTLKAFAEDDRTIKVLILQLKNTRDMDATVCLALEQLHDYLKGSGRQLICCGITPQIWEVLSHSGVVDLIGKENLFLFDERHPHQYMQRAIHRAKQLVHTHQQPPIISPILITPPASEGEARPQNQEA